MIAFGASDHNAISFTRFSKVPPIPARTIHRRSYKEFSKESFLLDMASVDWSDVYLSRDLDDAVGHFTHKFNELLNVPAPWIKFQKRKHFSPWLTKGTLELMSQRDLAKKRYETLVKNSGGSVTQEQKDAWA